MTLMMNHSHQQWESRGEALVSLAKCNIVGCLEFSSSAPPVINFSCTVRGIRKHGLYGGKWGLPQRLYYCLLVRSSRKGRKTKKPKKPTKPIPSSVCSLTSPLKHHSLETTQNQQAPVQRGLSRSRHPQGTLPPQMQRAQSNNTQVQSNAQL